MTGASGRQSPTAAGQGQPTVTDALLMMGQLCLDRGGNQGGEAVDWFRSAARGGTPAAINMLGRCYEHGWGVPPDPGLAAEYYLKAADLGDAWALFNLADLYFRGDGVAQDDDAAYRLYLAAARKGVVKALNMLGLLHERGGAVPADAGHALAYFRAGAEGGDCWGQFNYARHLIERGDVVAARFWLGEALKTGFPDFHRAMAAALADHPDAGLRALGRQAAARAGQAAGQQGGGR